MAFKNMFVSFRPLLRAELKDKQPLAERLMGEKDVGALSRLIAGNNIGIITVHPFYARYINDTTYYNHVDMLKQGYYDYEKDMVEFLSENLLERRAFHIFEDTTRSIDSAARAFAEYGRQFAWQGEPLYSPDGKILDMTSGQVLKEREKNLKSDDLEVVFAIKKNISTNALKRLESFLKEKDGVVLAGIFEDDCLKRARLDIEEMARTLIGIKKDFIIAVNKALTRKFEKIVYTGQSADAAGNGPGLNSA